VAVAISLDKDMITAFHIYPFDHNLCGSGTILLNDFFRSSNFDSTSTATRPKYN
jgi:hypothetical protein